MPMNLITVATSRSAKNWKIKLNFVRVLPTRIVEGLKWSFKESEPCFVTFGVAVLIGVIGFYFLNQNVLDSDSYENF